MKHLPLFLLISLITVIFIAGCPVSAESAEKWYDIATQLTTQGKLENDMGKMQKALDAYNQALKIDPNYTKAQENKDIVKSKLK